MVGFSFFYLPFNPFFWLPLYHALIFLTHSYFIIIFCYTNPLSDLLTENQVWNSQGTLLGKFFLGSVSSNFIFVGDWRLVVLTKTKIFLARIAAQEISFLVDMVIVYNWMFFIGRVTSLMHAKWKTLDWSYHFKFILCLSSTSISPAISKPCSL